MRLALLRGAALAIALSSFSLLGCSKKGGGPTAPAPVAPPPPGVTVSQSTPATGDGTLENRSVSISDVTVPAALKRVTIRGTYGTPGTANAKEHRIDVLFDPANSTIYSVTHRWGTDIDPGGPAPDAINFCGTGGTACGSGKVSVNQASKKVTFNSVVLFDMAGGSNSSTLLGNETYP